MHTKRGCVARNMCVRAKGWYLKYARVEIAHINDEGECSSDIFLVHMIPLLIHFHVAFLDAIARACVCTRELRRFGLIARVVNAPKCMNARLQNCIQNSVFNA